MRRHFNRPLLIWPGLATATMIALMWVTAPGNPFAPTFPVRHGDASVRGEQAGNGEGTREAFYQELGRDGRNRAYATVLETGPWERREQGTRAIALPPRIAKAFGIQQRDVTDRGATILSAPVLDEHRETAGIGYRLPHRDNAGHRVLSSDLLAPDWALIGSCQLDADLTGIVGAVAPSPNALTLHSPEREADDASRSLLELFQVTGASRKTGPGGAIPAAARRSDEAVTATALPDSVRFLAKPSSDASTGRDDAASRSALAAPGRADRWGVPGGWPAAPTLDQQLQRLAGVPGSAETQWVSQPADDASATLNSLAAGRAWSEEVSAQLLQLRALERLGDPRAEAILAALGELAERGRREAEQLSARDAQIDWLRAAHGVTRRIAVWQPVWDLAANGSDRVAALETVSPADVLQRTAAIRADLSGTGDESGWNRYLLLDEVDSAANSSDPDRRMVVAQRLLSRLQWHRLSQEQTHWLGSDSVVALADAVRPWASSAIDYAQLMSQIERQEADSVDVASIAIAEAVQTLRFTTSPQAVRLADALNAHYRNANVRLALSENLIVRLLPEIAPRSVPVRTRMLDSDIRGVSDIASDLNLQLVPAANSWSLQLRTLGQVDTRSVGSTSGVSVHTTSQAVFDAATPITITPQRVTIADTHVDVATQNRLRGIQSSYDNWPLVGSLVRSIATSRFEDLQPKSNRATANQVRTQVASEIDTRVQEKITESTRRLEQLVLGPLGRLQLDPTVMDMQTTNDRLLARYRLAGDWQLAAYTPRPRAPHSSLMSLQVHQSAINNTLEQMVPCDRPQTIQQMVLSTRELFGLGEAEASEELPADVMIQFARTRPITVEIEDGQVWVTLRVVQLSRGDSLDLRRFIVRAAYVPQVNGLEASLVRDAHLRISGPSLSMRERLPVRAIFNKVLSPSRPIPLVLPQLTQHPAARDLVVSQLELRDGWLALAIGEAAAARLASVAPSGVDDSSARDSATMQ